MDEEKARRDAQDPQRVRRPSGIGSRLAVRIAAPVQAQAPPPPPTGTGRRSSSGASRPVAAGAEDVAVQRQRRLERSDEPEEAVQDRQHQADRAREQAQHEEQAARREASPSSPHMMSPQRRSPLDRRAPAPSRAVARESRNDAREAQQVGRPRRREGTDTSKHGGCHTGTSRDAQFPQRFLL